MKLLFLILSFFVLPLISFSQSSSGRPKIGVTFSGGGAKGLAHIGILKAIDSAGLKVDYITGHWKDDIAATLFAMRKKTGTCRNIA